MKKMQWIKSMEKMKKRRQGKVTYGDNKEAEKYDQRHPIVVGRWRSPLWPHQASKIGRSEQWKLTDPEIVWNKFKIRLMMKMKETYAMIKGDRIHRHKIRQIVLVGDVISVPGHDVEWRKILNPKAKSSSNTPVLLFEKREFPKHAQGFLTNPRIICSPTPTPWLTAHSLRKHVRDPAILILEGIDQWVFYVRTRTINTQKLENSIPEWLRINGLETYWRLCNSAPLDLRTKQLESRNRADSPTR